MAKYDDLPQLRTRAQEIQTFYALIACIQELQNAEKALKKRSKMIPGGWRDLRLIRKKLDDLTSNLLGTVPLEKLQIMQKNLHYMCYVIKFNKGMFTPEPDWMLVKQEDINAIQWQPKQLLYAPFSKCSRCLGIRRSTLQ